MPVTLTIEVDRLDPELAKNLAGFFMACGGFCKESAVREHDCNISGHEYAPVNDPDKAELDAEMVNLQRYRDPAAVFAPAPPPAQVTSTISAIGPTLVIPAPPVEPAATLNPASVANGVTFDKSGLPWDVRIHASSKTFNGDGTWRAKRGVDKTIVAQVEDELRRVMALPGPVAVPAIPPPPSAPAPAATVPPPPAPAVTQASQMDFVGLVGRASSAMNQGKISEEQLAQCCQAVGIPSLPMLGARLDLVPQVAAMIDGIIAGKSA